MHDDILRFAEKQAKHTPPNPLFIADIISHREKHLSNVHPLKKI
jgi:hypothetical protein